MVFVGAGLMGHIQNPHGGHRAHQEDNIEPAVVEVEVDVAQYLRYYDSVVRRQVHPHQQDTGDEVHS